MAEISDVASGEVIEAAWGNQIRDRTFQRYANVTERDNLNATPTEGDLAYVESINEMQFYDGASWLSLLDDTSSYLQLAGGTMTGAVLFAVGSAAAPGIAFAGDANTGIYHPGADVINFVTGGTAHWGISASGNIYSVTEGVGSILGINEVQASSGGASDPSFTFTDNTDVGLFYSAGLAVAWGDSSDYLRLNTSGTLFHETTGVAQILFGIVGSASIPSYTFYGDSNTGMYRIAADRLGFATAGALRFEIDASGGLLPKNPGTTTNSGLAAWRQLNFASGANEILALTSSIAYKTDVQDVDTEVMKAKLLEIRLRSWKSKASADDKRKRYEGIILEEQAATEHWNGDEDITNAAVIPLIAVVQDLIGRVSTLERKAKRNGK